MQQKMASLCAPRNAQGMLSSKIPAPKTAQDAGEFTRCWGRMDTSPCWGKLDMSRGRALPLQVTPCHIPAPEGNFQGGRMNSEVSLSQLRARQKPRLSSGTNHSRVLVALPQLGRNQSSGADPRAQRHSGLSAPPCCGREPLWSRLEGSGPAGQVQHIPGGAGSCGRGDPRGSPR